MDVIPNLLLVYRSDSVRMEISENLSSYQKYLMTTDDMKSALNLTQQHPFSIALFELKLFDNSNTIFHRILESLQDTHLVAIVDEKENGDPIKKKLIHDHFFTFLSIPTSPRDLTSVIETLLWMRRFNGKDHYDQSIIVNGRKLESENPRVNTLIIAIQKTARVDAPVLIHGETGAGKELVARAIHHYSRRSNGPFITVNCGAIPRELMQSAFFGYERGAFTDAHQRHIGHIESASGGTLFLDEIGDLPFDMQVCLLRFLENHRIQRLGSHEDIDVDVRIVSATHVDMEEAISNGEFREDLYYRINVLSLCVPPLRDRLEDIENLVDSILMAHSDDRPVNFQGVSEAAMNLMKQYHWPGNIRELSNRLRRAMIMCRTGWIEPDDLALPLLSEAPLTIHIDKVREQAEKRTIRSALVRCNNNISSAAKELGVSRVTLYRLMEKHGIDRDISHWHRR
ncbi:sigma-54 interaction domain-containing protein [Billgrantia gudaonensis]|uniref:DNA-binding transcriptional response regulator, NtrC family, contains REC, AAA-type ATPase, and a Fis-type DNA-binding domains n=1 Tax=Billgrantia gudaonensis TaxID=376427 RepID=A0A1G8PGG1_9GAMM|nr:sigma-54 dependent transcriptional regulator [Halomonas gudaonensis]SDI91365.1 DNA-binding transcriptional response regulator, NtrC family, contains REC, AAA-type ATPase, and a Fis-type DNA-binding domains [Halomonas gudaonensis]